MIELTPIDIICMVVILICGTWKLYEITGIAATWTVKKIDRWVLNTCRPIECVCDARWSGRDEAEYRAKGCPSCICGFR